jgi:hypothetical protein
MPGPEFVEPGLVEIGFDSGVDSGLVGSEFSDFQFADLGISGSGVERLDLGVADSKPASVAPAAGSLCLVLVLLLPGAGMRWRWKEEQSVEPEPDYSEGA